LYQGEGGVFLQKIFKVPLKIDANKVTATVGGHSSTMGVGGGKVGSTNRSTTEK